MAFFGEERENDARAPPSGRVRSAHPQLSDPVAVARAARPARDKRPVLTWDEFPMARITLPA